MLTEKEALGQKQTAGRNEKDVHSCASKWLTPTRQDTARSKALSHFVFREDWVHWKYGRKQPSKLIDWANKMNLRYCILSHYFSVWGL